MSGMATGGQVFTWLGGTGDWLDTANWDPAGYALYDSSESAVIQSGTVILHNIEPNGIPVTLSGPGLSGGPAMELDNAALGPSLLLTAVGVAGGGVQNASLSVQGWDTNYGEIDIGNAGGTGSPAGQSDFVVNIGAGSQFNQEGTIALIPQETTGSGGAVLIVQSGFIPGWPIGVLNNDGSIVVGSGDLASFSTPIVGSGTIVLNGDSENFVAVANTQTVDFTAGSMLLINPGSFDAILAAWNPGAEILTGAGLGPAVESVQWNQTTPGAGNLQLFTGGGAQIGNLNVLGQHTTQDFSIILSGHGSTFQSALTVL